MTYTNIATAVEGHLGRITLNRPEQHNALSLSLLNEMIPAIDDIAATDGVKVVVIDAAGPSFSVGHDLNEMLDRPREFFDELFATCVVLMERVQEVAQPVIAMVQGTAAAAGCQLVAACDLVVASEESRFGTTGLRVGLFCSTPMVPLSRSIGRKRALEMLLTGETISAQTAADWGLVNRVVPSDQLEKATMELVDQIAEYSSGVVGLGKSTFYRQLEMSQGEAYVLTKDVIAHNAGLPDGQEGMGAFLEKRTPRWE